jgi:glycosyltransferase involved in cell wall biosynthesis
MVERVRPQPLRTRPTVSVVVPCYNYGRYLSQCVESVLSQEGVDVDVLIVDDASPDGSVAVARELAAADDRVKVLEHPVNKGHIQTYNDGLAAVDGEYVVLLSADDLLSPGSLARSTALMAAYPDITFVYGFSAGFNETPPPPRSRPSSWSVWSGPEWLTEMCRRGTNPVATPEVVMRGSTMRELVGYDARLPHAADFLLWLRAAGRGSVGRVNGADQAFYRIHGANMHVERYSGLFLDIKERRQAFEILFTDDKDYVGELAGLREDAERALAREALSAARRAYRLRRTDAEPPQRLAELAEELDPAARTTQEWRDYERTAQGGEPGEVPLRARQFADRVASRVRWGQWRRRGIRL